MFWNDILPKIIRTNIYRPAWAEFEKNLPSVHRNAQFLLKVSKNFRGEIQPVPRFLPTRKRTSLPTPYSLCSLPWSRRSFRHKFYSRHVWKRADRLQLLQAAHWIVPNQNSDGNSGTPALYHRRHVHDTVLETCRTLRQRWNRVSDTDPRPDPTRDASDQ